MPNTLDRAVGGIVQTEPRIRLNAAVLALRTLDSFWLTVLLLTALGTVSYLLPSGDSWQLLAAGIVWFTFGYQVSVARAVYLGAARLPALTAAPRVILRRGLSAFVTGLPLSAAAIVILLGLGFALESVPRVALAAMYVVGFVALASWLLVLSRYVASDRLDKRLGYVDAIRTFRANTGLSLSLIGYWLAGAALLAGLRYAAYWLCGIASADQQGAALAALTHGQCRRGVLLVLVSIVFAVLVAVWDLVSAHLLGQHARIADSAGPV